jgi:hypothetical protein
MIQLMFQVHPKEWHPKEVTYELDTFLFEGASKDFLLLDIFSVWRPSNSPFLYTQGLLNCEGDILEMVNNNVEIKIINSISYKPQYGQLNFTVNSITNEPQYRQFNLT